MATTTPSRETWMWPSSGLSAPDTWGTSLAPISFTCTVTSGPVSWLGVGETIWMRALVLGRSCALGLDDFLSEPQPVRPNTRTSRATGMAERLMAQTIRRRSPVLGGTRHRFPTRCPVRGRAAAAAPAGQQSADGQHEGDDADDESCGSRAIVAAGTAIGAGGGVGRRRRR